MVETMEAAGEDRGSGIFWVSRAAINCARAQGTLGANPLGRISAPTPYSLLINLQSIVGTWNPLVIAFVDTPTSHFTQRVKAMWHTCRIPIIFFLETLITGSAAKPGKI